jgi:hypothetical protein
VAANNGCDALAMRATVNVEWVGVHHVCCAV